MRTLIAVISIFVSIAFLVGCEAMVTTSAILKVQPSEHEKIESIVHSVFMQYGAKHSVSEGKNYYLLFKAKTSAGPLGPDFLVTYTSMTGTIIVHIQDRSGTGEDLKDTQKYLAEIVSLISKRLKESNLEVTVETKSYRFPAPSI